MAGSALDFVGVIAQNSVFSRGLEDSSFSDIAHTQGELNVGIA